MRDAGGTGSTRRSPVSRPPRGHGVCGVENCGGVTKNEKPYCREHMDLLQRADSIMNEVEARRAEVAAVLGAGSEGWKHVKVDGSIAREIIEVVKVFGAQTVPKLGKLVQLKRDILVPYVTALVRSGHLRVNKMHCGGRSLTDVVSPV